MLFSLETWQFVGAFCEPDGGRTPENAGTYRFINKNSASDEDIHRLIRFDNAIYFNKGYHIISNIDEVKDRIGYKSMTYDEFNERVKECMEKGIELYGIDW